MMIICHNAISHNTQNRRPNGFMKNGVDPWCSLSVGPKNSFECSKNMHSKNFILGHSQRHLFQANSNLSNCRVISSFPSIPKIVS